jgi:hypothetical protein
LRFNSRITKLPASFVLDKGEAGEQSNSEGFALVKSDFNGEVRADLHMNVSPLNDDFRITFNTAVFHEGTDFKQLFAFGFLIGGNAHSEHEVLRVYDSFVCITRC